MYKVFLGKKDEEPMTQSEYDKKLLKWAKSHYWNSLEKDKALIIRHLRTFIGDINENDIAEKTTNLSKNDPNF